jgi:membrane protease YdiL (CAAX protease family)
MDQADKKLEVNARPEIVSSPNETGVSPHEPNFAGAAQASYAHTLFFDPDGLRPGWGFAAYVISFYLLRRLASDLLGLVELGQLRSIALDEFVALLTATIPVLVLMRIERRRWDAYGLPLRNALGKYFWAGVVWGFIGITLLLTLLYALHGFDFGPLALHGLRIVKFAAFWGGVFLLVGLYEEFLLRGYAQFTLTRGIGFWPAAFVLSCLFGLMHRSNPGEGWAGLFAAALIGFFFCFTLRRTGSLWFAVGFHAAWDWGETFFYAVPDSGGVFPGHLLRSSLHGKDWLTGGSVGPEGSVFCFVVIAIIWIAFDRVYRVAKWPLADVPVRD